MSSTVRDTVAVPVFGGNPAEKEGEVSSMLMRFNLMVMFATKEFHKQYDSDK